MGTPCSSSSNSSRSPFAARSGNSSRPRNRPRLPRSNSGQRSPVWLGRRVPRLVGLRAAAAAGQDALNAKLASDNGLAGQVASKSAALSRAEDALGGYVLTAGDRFHAALGKLAAIPQAPALTADQKKAIND